MRGPNKMKKANIYQVGKGRNAPSNLKACCGRRRNGRLTLNAAATRR